MISLVCLLQTCENYPKVQQIPVFFRYSCELLSFPVPSVCLSVSFISLSFYVFFHLSWFHHMSLSLSFCLYSSLYLSICVSSFLCVSLSVSLLVSVTVSPPLYVHFSISIYSFLSIYLSLSQPVSLSLHLYHISPCLSLCVSVSLNLCISRFSCLSFCFSLSLSACTSVSVPLCLHLSTCLSISPCISLSLCLYLCYSDPNWPKAITLEHQCFQFDLKKKKFVLVLCVAKLLSMSIKVFGLIYLFE